MTSLLTAPACSVTTVPRSRLRALVLSLVAGDDDPGGLHQGEGLGARSQAQVLGALVGDDRGQAVPPPMSSITSPLTAPRVTLATWPRNWLRALVFMSNLRMS